MHDIGRAAKIAPTSIAYYYSTRERLLHDVLIHQYPSGEHRGDVQAAKRVAG